MQYFWQTFSFLLGISLTQYPVSLGARNQGFQKSTDDMSSNHCLSPQRWLTKHYLRQGEGKSKADSDFIIIINVDSDFF